MKFWWKSLLAGTVMVAALVTPAFAQETVKLNGYKDYEVGGAITAQFQVSISNVVRKEETNSGYADGTYYCQGKTEVVALDQLSGFGASKMEQFDNGPYIETEYLVPDGYTEEAWLELMNDEMIPVEKGTKFTLDEPGVYYVYGNYGPLAGGVGVTVVVEAGQSQPSSQPAAEQKQAVYNQAAVSLNGQPIELEAYNIDGNNYFKLRDFALILADTPQCFDVAWDQEKQVINLVSGQVYSRAQVDTLAKGDGQNKTAISYESGILLDSAKADLRAYTINDNNFFQLRDLCGLFGVDVQWDGAKNQISLTAK